MNNETKKCEKCQLDIPLKATKCPHCQTDLRSWWRRHPVSSLVLGCLIGIPFLSGIISGITDTGTSKTPEVKEFTPRPVPTLTLTERLQKTVNDPYWASTTPADYSDNTKLQVQSILFSTYANEVAEGEKSTSTEDKKLASELKKKLIAKQVSEYPKMRNAYADFAGTTLWEQDIDVSSSGTGNTTITFVGAIFASNKGIDAVQTPLEDMLKELRFKRVNYKWYSGEDDYTYFNLKTPTDSALLPVSL